ncbi:NADH:flavin oxidoreductase/NADH oxidase [Cellulomonas sp. zg-ZUI222]|uniref:NADH:flavin oxidoreductase/NADH oxidase n=1 Tax=Cellulomonas wangleii TaxID=2816956 RepID=A0ABX8D2V6_9CELL|nr:MULTISPECIES: NADH:flavin oxidoreductase/NADH oxidase [Cellulomonas]MBO0899385.1 NADH:flavin oxidoreductase/NADH oxidase [Cellulomonas sp. zg-ZUI22]MBO0920237.1 NADH:flavin oxidoreductase/NADH oxidase [Cellulomonas wangleii]MBO0923337.1 NADH:flavin oxidoreductase/NADH oxidase [Cellulomonas wangleii]QVI61694.1 NADH:flavin oxidoreductase/NADH oxidase [Cellulomonas wangleii]
MPTLFTPLTLRGTTFAHRVWMAPMCQYSAVADGPDAGAPAEWHLQHYGARAAGGAAHVIVEATAVVPEGRITPFDLGLWDDAQVAAHRRVVELVHAQGARAGVQLAHAGRKASTDAPWNGGAPVPPGAGGWPVVGPSAVPFAEGHPVPTPLTVDGIAGVVAAFADAARRAVAAGYDVVEVHAAHGYLLHQFCSPDSNVRDDGYGGGFDGRTRLVREVTSAVRAAIPDGMPLLVRVSATDWVEPAGWTADDTVRLARDLAPLGVDMVHVSTGGNLPGVHVPVEPGYQVPFAARVRAEAGLPTIAVGAITDPAHAERVVADGSADAVALARPLLVDPFWPHRAAVALGADLPLPPQYDRARALL